jgi:hypothetical protein
MESEGLIKLINDELAIELPEKISFEELKERLSVQINYLIEKDFQKLVSLLYRVDVSETKLKNLLLENQGENAGNIIAELIIERQLQKIKSRQQFKQKTDDIDESEKW